MTLSTNIYVLDETSPHELFRFCQTLLTKYDDRHRPWNRQKCSDEPRQRYVGRDANDKAVFEADGSGVWNIANDLGQGLPGILDITYRPDGPLRTSEQADAHDGDCDDDCSGEYHDRACWMDVDFDTAYGYKDPEGRGCGDLHALLVAQVGQYLDEHDVRWEWRNEFTGDVHGGEDRCDRLIDLCSGGSEATAWFQTSALPAIVAHIEGERP